MHYTLAPLEGITGYLFRSAHAAVFGSADTYMTPFLSPTQTGCFSPRETRDVAPEHNAGLHVVPQLLTNNAENFIWAARKLRDMSYGEINLNLGCPSGTVTSKGKGSGFLAFPDALDRFFDAVFSQIDGPISVKTRLGKTEAEEFPRLLEIYNRYPISELTIHPRVQADLYRGKPRLESFDYALHHARAPLCYNGDIFSPAHMAAFSAKYPGVESVMVGRGVVTNPALIRQLKGGAGATAAELRDFHDRLYAGYCDTMPGTRAILAKMKELWAYLSFSFTDRDRAAKPIRKATRLPEYEAAVDRLFREHQVLPAGVFDQRTM